MYLKSNQRNEKKGKHNGGGGHFITLSMFGTVIEVRKKLIKFVLIKNIYKKSFF